MIVTGQFLLLTSWLWYKNQSTSQNSADRFEALNVRPVGEILEFHKLRSPRDQLQNRVLRRGPWRQDHQPAAHLPKDRRAAEGQDDLPRHRNRAHPVFRLPAA